MIWDMELPADNARSLRAGLGQCTVLAVYDAINSLSLAQIERVVRLTSLATGLGVAEDGPSGD